MVSFRTLYLVIACLLLEHVPRQQAISFQTASLLLLAVATAFLAICMLLGVACLRGSRRESTYLIDRLGVCRRRFETGWTLLYPVFLAATGWHQWAFTPDPESTVTVATVAMLFGPHVVAMLALEVLMAAMVADVSAADTTQSEVSKLHWGEAFQMGIRQGGLLSLLMCITPMLVILSMQHSYVSLSAVMPWELTCVAVGVPALTMFMLFPRFVGWFLGTRGLEDSTMRSRVDRLLKSSGCKRLGVRLLDGPGWATAAVVGWLPWGQQLWLGQALVDQLSEEELDLVVLHEVAHVRKWHFAYRLLPAAWAVGLSVLYVWATNDLWSQAGLAGADSALVIIASVLVFLVGLIVVSRACELEADREACELARHLCDWSAGRAGEPNARLATALCRLLGNDERAARGSWLHPSLADRLRNLAEDLTNQKRRLGADQVATG
ncbi:MAG: M48 family metalloprotease [Planctomycetota bacterium]